MKAIITPLGRVGVLFGIFPILSVNRLHRYHSSYPSATPILPLSIPQKTFLTVGSACLGLLNPWRGDMIAVLDFALGSMLKTMKSTSEGCDLLKEKFRVTSVTVPLSPLLGLPENTFGYQYASFMQKQGFASDDRATVRLVDDPEQKYVLQRYREIHDYLHVLYDLPTTVVGEIAQKWLEMHQTGLPSAALSSLVGPLRLPFEDKRLLLQRLIPWSLEANRALDQTAEPLLTIYYERYFGEDLDVLRKRLHIVPATAAMQ